MCVRRGTDANAKTCDEAECSSHANEGSGKCSDGREQGTVKASLVLILASAAGFPQHSGNSGTALPLSHANGEVVPRGPREIGEIVFVKKMQHIAFDHSR